MARKIKDIESEALRLSIAERAELAKRLIESLDDISEDENDHLWAQESERRYSEYKAGRITAIPAEEVFARVRSRKK